MLHAVRCANPFRGVMREDSVKLVAYSGDKESDIFVEGGNVTFTCPSGLVLTGPNTSTCMGNGEWEPDLHTGQLSCKGDMKNIYS